MKLDVLEVTQAGDLLSTLRRVDSIPVKDAGCRPGFRWSCLSHLQWRASEASYCRSAQPPATLLIRRPRFEGASGAKWKFVSVADHKRLRRIPGRVSVRREDYSSSAIPPYRKDSPNPFRAGNQVVDLFRRVYAARNTEALC